MQPNEPICVLLNYFTEMLRSHIKRAQLGTFFTYGKWRLPVLSPTFGDHFKTHYSYLKNWETTFHVMGTLTEGNGEMGKWWSIKRESKKRSAQGIQLTVRVLLAILFNQQMFWCTHTTLIGARLGYSIIPLSKMIIHGCL